MIMTVLTVVILTMAVVIPIIEQQEESTKEYNVAQNSPDYKMTKGNSSYSTTIAVVSSTESSYTFSIGGTNHTFTGDDSMMWICNNGGIYLTATGGKVWNANVSATMQNFAASSDAEAGTISVTFSDGSMRTQTAQGSSRTSPYSWVLYPDDSGTLGFYSGAFNITAGDSFYVAFFDNAHAAVGYGTTSSLRTLVIASGVSATFTANATASDTYDAVTSVSMTYQGSSATPVGCIADVDYNESVKEDGSSIVGSLVAIVPVILIVCVILMAVNYLYRRD